MAEAMASDAELLYVCLNTVVLADLVCDRRVRKIPRRMSGSRYAVRRTPTPTPYITWNASATVILLLDVEESASEKHHLWTFDAGMPYADAVPVRSAVRHIC